MPDVFTWPALSTWVAYTTIIGVILALLALTRSRIQNWATSRAVYQLIFWARQQVLLSSVGAVARRTRMRLWVQELCHSATMRLVPILYRASIHRLVETVDEELRKNTVTDIYFPSPDADPLYVEIAAYIDYKERRTRDRDLMRRHKGVRCAGGCGTKYGKKRKDHNFVGGGGVKDSGGWFCEWMKEGGATGSCLPKATGDHYCGMCSQERSDSSESNEE